jgi:magnesium chelatase family protein
MVGPPGSGKSMLAQRLPGLLGPLSEEEGLECAALQGLGASAGSLEAWSALRTRPVRAPHHSASSVALVGGGSPPRPGEISLAHGGVLFLDELPEFTRGALEALREPLETGHITISRAARRARFPARFQLVAAMNPCPCGWQGAFAATGRACRCTPDAISRYRGRISGPLLDRIDMQVEVPAVKSSDLLGQGPGEDTATVAERVARAQGRQMARQSGLNAQLDVSALGRWVVLGAPTNAFLQKAAERLGWSARSVHRVMKLGRTIADMEGAETLTVAHLAEAIQYRRALAET